MITHPNNDDNINDNYNGNDNNDKKIWALDNSNYGIYGCGMENKSQEVLIKDKYGNYKIKCLYCNEIMECNEYLSSRTPMLFDHWNTICKGYPIPCPLEMKYRKQSIKIVSNSGKNDNNNKKNHDDSKSAFDMNINDSVINIIDNNIDDDGNNNDSHSGSILIPRGKMHDHLLNHCSKNLLTCTICQQDIIGYKSLERHYSGMEYICYLQSCNVQYYTVQYNGVFLCV